MGVAIRETKLKSDKIRLSLDIYHQGKSKFENLKLYLYDKPKSQVERDHNKRTKVLAESIRAKRVLDIQEDKYNIHTGFKRQGSFIEYFKRLTRERRKEVTNYGNWYSTCKHLVNFANGRNITFEDCNDKFLNEFKEYLLHGKVTKGHQNLSNASASSYLNKIKAALTQAHNENIITDNPGKRIKGISVPESNRQYLLLEEIRLLVKTECKIPVLKKAFLFGCLTGLRWSDINKLVWKEIIYSESEGRWKILYTQQKTKNVEYHPITQQAYDLLPERGEDAERVFKGLKYSAWHNHILSEWILLAGIKKYCTFHSSRHSHAVLLLTQGADIYTVSKLLGHRNITTTQVYAKIIDPKKNATVDLLPDIGI